MSTDHSDGLWGAALRASADIGLAILGAAILVGRFLAEHTSGLFPPEDDAPSGRHDVEKVRERARAAQQAARASGLLSRRRR